MGEENSFQLVSDLASHLLLLSRPNKDFLVKTLRQVASALSQIEQPLVRDSADKQEALKQIQAAIRPLKKCIIKHGLLSHRDKDVRLLVTICVSEIFRILAPEPLFEDKYLRGIFNLFLSAFLELSDTASPYFSKRAKILETISRCKCCVIMLDVGLHDLVHEMFNIFFSVVRGNHQQSLINEISSIMADILKEEASSSLVELILQNLVEGKDGPSAAMNLASSVIQRCTDTLEPFVSKFLASCFAEKDAIRSNLKESYHEIVFNIFQIAPEMLLAVIPNLTQELLTDQVDVRMKALNVTGKIFALPNRCYGDIYQDLFAKFLKRFSDKSAEVRMTALKWGKKCYMANPSGASEILTAIQERLLDFDAKVRTQALVVACDLAKFDMKYVPAALISEASERLRDKEIYVRKRALEKLIEVYQDYCNKCSEGCMTISDHFEQIPCKVLLLCCDKDTKEFRPQSIELVLSDHLFPSALPVAEIMRHWIHLFSVLNPLHLKSLNSILSQKRRLQNEMRQCLTLWKEEKDHDLEEMHRKRECSFVKMSASFPDPPKAVEFFHKLDRMRDGPIFDALAQLLDELSCSNAQIMREKFLKLIGDKHPLQEFLCTLSTKCSSNIFSSEHVQYALHQLCSSGSKNLYLKASSIKLLLAVLNIFPAYLRGSEGQFLKLLEEDESIADDLIEVLSKAAPHMTFKLSNLYPILERMCLEGTRSQSKVAVSALASLTGSSEKLVFSELCEVLLHSLLCGRNIPTVLQSLGCVGQYSVSAFEHIYRDIRSYIYQNIFQAEASDDEAPCDQSSGCSNSCRLKIYGLKALVKSFLPHCGQVTRKIDDLLNILEKMLKSQKSCDYCGTSVRLAAAKSVLRLSRKWDLHVSPKIFCLTILMAKDSDPFINRSFIGKVHKLLKEHILPIRYACAFSFAVSGPLKDLQDDSQRYMKEFIKDASREARPHHNSSSQGGSLTDCPAYVIVFLIHVLAHDADFPSENCKDENVYAQFCYPLFSALQALVSTSNVECNMDVAKEAVVYLLYIFRAIKRAEDAIDAFKTPRLHILADIGISAVNALNRNVITSPNAPHSILLPSSLYRIGVTNMLDNQENAKSHTHAALEQSFIGKIVRILLLESETMSGQKCQQDSTLMVSKNKKLPLVLCNLAETSTTGVTEANKKDLRCSRKRAPSALAKKCATLIEQKNASPKKSKRVTEEEHISSCSSLILRPSVESDLPIEKLERRGTCLKDNIGSSENVNSSSGLRTKSKGESVLKDISNQGGAIVGQRIRLLSPVDGCLHLGTIEGFNFKSNSYKIACDNGDVEMVFLDNESLETLSQGSLEGKDILGKETESFRSLNCIDENVHTRPTATGQKLKTLIEKQSRKLPTIKSTKGRRVSRDTSASEVTNASENIGGRRSRRERVS